MRINSYRFPENVDANTRWKNGSQLIKGNCTKNCETCRNCPHKPEEGWQECSYFVATESEDTIEGISISFAKKLLKQYGGSAVTYHCERDGSVFETTPITLTKNNSRFQYNRHL